MAEGKGRERFLKTREQKVSIFSTLTCSRFAAALQADRGASRLVHPIKMRGFRSKRKRYALQTIHFYGVLNNYNYRG